MSRDATRQWRSVHARTEKEPARAIMLIAARRPSTHICVSTALLAMMDVLLEEGMVQELAAAYFIEHDDLFAQRVAGHWRDEAAARGIPVFTRMGKDIWEPFRWQMELLLTFCFTLPVGAVVLMVGGSPCTNLNRAAYRQGAVGICGEYSMHFHIFPILGWFVQFLRPDVNVLSFVENAHNMLKN